MSALHGLILGIVQGLSEFLPISSSGHLLLTSYILGIPSPPIVFDLVLHLGTVLSLFFFLKKEIVYAFKKVRLILLLMTSIIFTGVTYFPFKKVFEESYETINYLPFFFMFTALYLTLFYLRKRGDKKAEEISFFSAIILGVLQGIAIFPGISRSGMVLVGGVLLGMKEEESFKYTFLLAIPSIIIASFYKFYEYIKAPIYLSSSPLILGFLFSFIFGLISLYILLKVVKRREMFIFSMYLFILSIVIFYLIKR